MTCSKTLAVNITLITVATKPKTVAYDQLKKRGGPVSTLRCYTGTFYQRYLKILKNMLHTLKSMLHT